MYLVATMLITLLMLIAVLVRSRKEDYAKNVGNFTGYVDMEEAEVTPDDEEAEDITVPIPVPRSLQSARVIGQPYGQGILQ